VRLVEQVQPRAAIRFLLRKKQTESNNAKR
jgi:hypothetical protein